MKYYASLEDENCEEGFRQWLGAGALRLGLSGQATRAQLEALFLGFDPFENKPLVQNAGKPSRRPGWDFTFSAPKSLSILWALSDAETRCTIERIHAESVRQGIQYLESEAAFTRTGGGGRVLHPAGLVAAAFPHFASRSLDPQLHTHVLIFNVGIRDEGPSGTLLSTRLYDEKLTLGAAYRAALAARLRAELGLSLRTIREWFEIDCIPHTLIREFSSRRSAIEALLGESGRSSARASAMATVLTKEAKVAVPKEALLSRWADQARNVGFALEQQSSRARDKERKQPRGLEKFERDSKAAAALLPRVIEKVCRTQSHFRASQLTRAVLTEGVSLGLEYQGARAAVLDAISSGEELVRLTRPGTRPVLTSKQVLATEVELLGATRRIATAQVRPVPRENAAHALLKAGAAGEHHILTMELLASPQQLSVLVGPAGPLRESVLEIAANVWEANGREVIGCAVSGTAARHFELRTGVQTATLAKHKWLGEPCLVRAVSHAIKQIGRAALRKRAYSRETLSIGRNTVLIVEQAGQLGTSDLLWLMNKCEQAGSKLVLSDDPMELPSIAGGNPFSAIAELSHRIDLSGPGRPKLLPLEWVVTSLREDNVGQAIQALESMDRLRNAPSFDIALDELSQNWVRLHSHSPGEALVLANTGIEANLANKAIQAARAYASGDARRVEWEGDAFFEGDRVLFTRTSRKLLVQSGMFGTIEAVDLATKALAVMLDDGTLTRFRLSEFSNLVLGYALSAHQARGLSVPHAHVLLSESRGSLPALYSQVSCGQLSTTVYEVGTTSERRQRTIQRYERTIEKGLAIEVVR